MSDAPPPSPVGPYNVASILVSALTSVIYLLIFTQGAGNGMTAGLGSVVVLFLIGGGGLLVAFGCAIAGMIRGEEPIIVTLLASIIPMILVAFAIFK